MMADLALSAQRGFDEQRSRIGLFDVDSTKAAIRKLEKSFDLNVRSVMTLIAEAESKPIHLERSTSLFEVLNPVPYREEFKYRNAQFFIYRDALYAAIGPYNQAECALLIVGLADKERKHFDRISTRQDGDEARETVTQRERIPEKVRISVWRRDQGQCARCGSRLKLEFDHIIPIAEGGGNTVRNVELLCEQCNRSKGAKIE